MYEVHIPGWMGDSLQEETKSLKVAIEEAKRLRQTYSREDSYYPTIKPWDPFVIINRVHSFRLFGWGITLTKKVRWL